MVQNKQKGGTESPLPKAEKLQKELLEGGLPSRPNWIIKRCPWTWILNPGKIFSVEFGLSREDRSVPRVHTCSMCLCYTCAGHFIASACVLVTLSWTAHVSCDPHHTGLQHRGVHLRPSMLCGILKPKVLLHLAVLLIAAGLTAAREYSFVTIATTSLQVAPYTWPCCFCCWRWLEVRENCV